MRKLGLAILFAAFIAATPALAARCGGDFNTFVASDVAGGSRRRRLASA